MPTRPFEFANAAGDMLSGRIKSPAGHVHAWAVFAHCFTCGKDNLAATRISRRLAELGIGVLRFDFTGLGTSKGEFAETSFSLNVQDLVAAAEAMDVAAMPPTLLIGHSLGGAATLAAAEALPRVLAIATIATPFDVAHVLGQFTPGAIAEIERNGSAKVLLSGRPFTVGRKMIEDLGQNDLHAQIAQLSRPLLLLHSPTDQVVSIDNVSQIFLAARHPKSFISLDGADHLLSSRRDADFAANMIAAWVSRYLTEQMTASATARTA